PTRSPYWRENVFLLQTKSSFALSPDPELPTLLWQIEPPPDNLWEKQPHGTVLSYFYLEQNNLYQSLAEGDHWFWYKLLNKQEQKVTLRFESSPMGEVFLRLWIYSATEAPVQPDHALQVIVNDNYVQEISWDGKGYQQVEVFVPAEYFRQGENQLTLSIPDLEGVFAQVSYLDKIDFYHWQILPSLAEAFQFKFFADESLNLDSIESLGSELWIWSVDDPLNPRQLGRAEELPVAGELKRYLWANKRGFQTPSALRLIMSDAMQVQDDPEITYLAIGPKELLVPLKPLLDLRKAEGLAIETAVEDIYDWYSGFAEPQAIRAYLTKAIQEYPSLQYVLLVGDATYDPAQNITKAESNRLPTFFVDTIFGGQTSTELPFSILNQPGLDFLDSEPVFQPTIAVGRLPASSPQQVRQWVSKVLEYEKGGMKPHTEAVLAVADPHEAYFSREATDFTELWDIVTHKDVFLPQAGETDLQEKIQTYFQQDYQVIAYFGHGAIDLWGKDEIFTAQEAQALTGQGSYPIVLNFTCLTGYYIHPEVMSLTESLLWNPKGGAILVIAPTSLTLADDQGFLWKAFVESYQGQKKGRIGDVWRDTLARIPLTNEGIRDVVVTYTVFGDPATTLP
ncbi:MAG: C25 family cysteine peptidase, partial [Anaerolineales bacterium]|nr:C25 family cysteine peptidase [Anaerolineales bacterium]